MNYRDTRGFRRTAFADLVGLTLTGVEIGDETVSFTTTDGRGFKLYHEQDCCEDVSVGEVHGDPNDLLGTPIVVAEVAAEGGSHSYGTYTWTFYKLATVKGWVTIRFVGESNGYYSESVDFAEVPA